MLVVRTLKGSSSFAVARQRASWYTCTRVCARARPFKRAYNAVKSESAELDRNDTDTRKDIGTTSGVQKALERKANRSNTPNVKVLDCLPITSYTGLLSSAGKARNPGGLNTVLESYSEQPADARIPLHGGLPHPDAFPISQLSVKLKSGASLTIDKVDLASQNVQYLIRLHVQSLYELIGLALPAGNHSMHSSMLHICWYADCRSSSAQPAATTGTDHMTVCKLTAASRGGF